MGKYSTKQRVFIKKNKVKIKQEKGKLAIVVEKNNKSQQKTAAIIAICILAALLITAFILWRTGTFVRWFPGSDSMVMEDYSVIELEKGIITGISDEDAQKHLESIADSYKEPVDEGEVQDGDTVYINYFGTIGNEEFEGGQAENYPLVIGSDSFIDGFEDGLIGIKTGESTVLHLQFPEDYSDSAPELNGKKVDFAVDVLRIERAPEINDEFILEHIDDIAGKRLRGDTEINTVDEFKTWYKEHGNDLTLYTEMMTALTKKQTVNSRNLSHLADVREYTSAQFASDAASYGLDADTLATYYGHTNAAEYVEEHSKETYDQMLLLNHIAEEMGLALTDEEKDAEIQKAIDENPDQFTLENGDTLTVEELKNSDPAWVMLYLGIEVNYYRVMPALKDRVVFIEPQIETGTEAGAELPALAESTETGSDNTTEAETDSAASDGGAFIGSDEGSDISEPVTGE